MMGTVFELLGLPRAFQLKQEEIMTDDDVNYDDYDVGYLSKFGRELWDGETIQNASSLFGSNSILFSNQNRNFHEQFSSQKDGPE